MSDIYSQGVAGDGAVILCDGLPITPDRTVEMLNWNVKCIKELEDELREWCQVYEQITGHHPVNSTDALKHGLKLRGYSSNNFCNSFNDGKGKK